MRILLYGGAGFIGKNLAIKLSKKQNNEIIVVDKNNNYFDDLKKVCNSNVSYIIHDFKNKKEFNNLLHAVDIVYYLYSSSIPSMVNDKIPKELNENVVFASEFFDACVDQKVKKIVFISSGGAVYGKEAVCPIKENDETNPISSYGIEKLTIEKTLFLYNYLYGIDYRIIRLSNPYGPYQNPNGLLGVISTFIYKALKDETIFVYGNGSVIRDFIYIDDAIEGIIKISNYKGQYKLFNLGNGIGISVNEIIHLIFKVLNKETEIEYISERKAEIPENYLDMTRYKNEISNKKNITLEKGIKKTADFMRNYYKI